jgi:hypothetical protein
MKSILLPEFKGVAFFSGSRGSGKTYFAAHADFPQNIAFFDFDEGKGEGLHKQLNFGYYKPVEENEPLKRADMFFSEIQKIKKGKYTTVIIDNILPLEKALQASVYRDAKKWAKVYGYTANDILIDSYGKARGIANDLIGDAITKPLHSKGVKLIVVTSHIKDKYKTPGKMVIDGRDRWQVLSILTLILINGDIPPVPSAIVQKEQLASISVSDTGDIQAIMKGEKPSHQIVRRLPARLPKADWQSLRWYMHNPANLNEPAKGEKLVEAEIEPFRERLSKEQIAYQLASLEKENREIEEAKIAEALIRKQQEKAIRDYITENKLDSLPSPIRLSKVREAIEVGDLIYDGEMTPALVK